MTYRQQSRPAEPVNLLRPLDSARVDISGRAEVVAALRVFYEARDQMDPNEMVVVRRNVTDDDLLWAKRCVSEFVDAVDEFIDSIRATFAITNGEVG